jgi:Family of unknown function (DUF5989)
MVEGQSLAEATKKEGAVTFLWKRKSWWLLPLAVLILLLVAIYVLVHLSASDPETYPTSWRVHSSYSRLC